MNSRILRIAEPSCPAVRRVLEDSRLEEEEQATNPNSFTYLPEAPDWHESTSGVRIRAQLVATRRSRMQHLYAHGLRGLDRLFDQGEGPPA